MEIWPRQIITPKPKFSLDLKWVNPNLLFNSKQNLENLRNENWVLEMILGNDALVLYRKLVWHSWLFDSSIIYDTSSSIRNPLARPVRRDELEKWVINNLSRMSSVILEYLTDKYSNPEEFLILYWEASLANTWPLKEKWVPSIRMIHNHLMVFENNMLKNARIAENNENLTDWNNNFLFTHLIEVYKNFFEKIQSFDILEPIENWDAKFWITWFPHWLPSWRVKWWTDQIKNLKFWQEYDQILKWFLDFYRTFFWLVSNPWYKIWKNILFPNQVENELLYNNDFHAIAKEIRDKVDGSYEFGSSIRWDPAYKQVLFRNEKWEWIVTISQNSIWNAITELLWICVDRVEKPKQYAELEPRLVQQLLQISKRLERVGLWKQVNTEKWASISERN